MSISSDDWNPTQINSRNSIFFHLAKMQLETKHLIVLVQGNCVYIRINLPTCCKISFPNGNDDIMDFRLTIAPTNGLPSEGKD
ncbi:hypothetical protein LXL04_035384 [Taraxacum kok-saghyz]